MKKIKLLLLGYCVLIGCISFAAAANTIAPEKEVKNTTSMTLENSHHPANSEAREYLLGPGDQVRIWVYGEKEMSMSLKIGKRGDINFPYIGRVQLSGQTTDSIEHDIETRLKAGFIRSPMVTVTMEGFRKFYLLGEVENPNGYEYEPQLTVEQAIAMAGGFTDRADRGDINIRPSGKKEMIKKVEMTHSVYPGDVVIVEKSFF
ncbi:polysaccharide biosynthesis/export family protein [Vibrio coralliirubri]|uniref:polysaccharide biosynthesis/export family protein n=1 Tax=Vibrio coralliirubri TaxID=1516159 RepID=UPI00062FFC5C|nr:polysaccharide biosynthesis/export family protein [Vibrio coralliirubri]CDT83616.1 putative polysaccharide biosynthesis/export protein (modular protein) [Vibrio coralliirubri]